MQDYTRLGNVTLVIQPPLFGDHQETDRSEVETLADSICYKIDTELQKYGVWSSAVVLTLTPEKVHADLKLHAGDYQANLSVSSTRHKHPARGLANQVLRFLRAKHEEWG